jgi:hypothetical protein
MNNTDHIISSQARSWIGGSSGRVICETIGRRWWLMLSRARGKGREFSYETAPGTAILASQGISQYVISVIDQSIVSVLRLLIQSEEANTLSPHVQTSRILYTSRRDKTLPAVNV